jgi:predicted NUDIX family NTP pyrophosphohydrolase
MARKSAGLLMFRRRPGGRVEVLLAHPGGPFWARKDEGAWSLPKGEYGKSEEPLEAAKREFTEETGFPVSGPFLALGTIKQAGGKTVLAWAFESDCDPRALVSNEFEVEWPPGSGRKQSFKEVDRASWFGIDEARTKLLKGQVGFVDALLQALAAGASPGER